MPESAVVIVHMQPFMTYTLKEKEEALFLAQEKVLEHCSLKNYPALLVEWPDSDKTVKRIKDAYEKVPRHELIEKRGSDGFTYSNADKILKKWNVKYLLMIGMWASGCVFATAKGAHFSDYEIILPLDCVEDKRNKDTEYLIQSYRNDLDAKVFYQHPEALKYIDALRNGIK